MTSGRSRRAGTTTTNPNPNPNPSPNQVANLLHDQGRLEEARQLFEEALDACREQLGDRHEHTLVLINNLGSLLYDQV